MSNVDRVFRWLFYFWAASVVLMMLIGFGLLFSIILSPPVPR